MTTASCILYGVYLVWLCAGCIDFLCHRRADLAHTSGLPESLLHLLQTALMALMVVVWMAVAPGFGPLLLMATLVVAHAAAGYADTRVAWRRRPITPLEQHIHSILDAAPWVLLAAVAYAESPETRMQGWSWSWRAPAYALPVWAAILLPGFALCALPLARELWTAWRAMRSGAGP